MKKIIINNKCIDLVFRTPTDSGKGFWFGYYNFDPLNVDHGKILCNRVEFDGRSILPDDKISVGWFDIASNQWNSIGDTYSFNWQQGAHLQWIPKHNNCLIFNSVDNSNNRYCSIEFNTETRTYKKFDFPIYALLPDGTGALCLNYERSYWCRAYHYQPIRNEKYNLDIDHSDGVFRLDFESNSIKRIVSLDDIIATDYDEDFKNSKHWLEHLMINKEGTRCVVLHRYSGENVMQYKTRVVVFNIDGSQIKVVNGWDSLQWSHVGWLDENRFVSYTVTPKKIINKSIKKQSNFYALIKKIYYKVFKKILPKKLRKKIQASGCYRLYEIEEDSIVELKRLECIGDIDGHPSFTNDCKYMITDTYPDDKGMQHLYIYSLITKKSVELGKFYAYFKGNPASCDLHPKLSRDNKFVMVDTAYSGAHHLLLFKINWEFIKSEIDK